ncbi:MAG: uroporphyrinogen-III synthase [Candidatus Puniceispirillales bacterium]
MISPSSPLAITTRPAIDGLGDCQYLQSCGLSSLSQPVLDIVPLSHPPLKEKLAMADAIILTSRHAASLIIVDTEQTELLDKPCYVVGDATAKAAHQAGFHDIHIAGGDGNALLGLVQSSEYSHFCWPSAYHSGFNLKTALEEKGDKTVDRVIVYEAKPINSLHPDTIMAIQSGRPLIILVHSGRAGEHFSHLLDQHELDTYRQNMTLVVISARAAGLCGQGWHKIHVIASPLRSMMLAEALSLAGISDDNNNMGDMPLD